MNTKWVLHSCVQQLWSVSSCISFSRQLIIESWLLYVIYHTGQKTSPRPSRTGEGRTEGKELSLCCCWLSGNGNRECCTGNWFLGTPSRLRSTPSTTEIDRCNSPELWANWLCCCASWRRFPVFSWLSLLDRISPNFIRNFFHILLIHPTWIRLITICFKHWSYICVQEENLDDHELGNDISSFSHSQAPEF